jgi:hypothetical protein
MCLEGSVIEGCVIRGWGYRFLDAHSFVKCKVVTYRFQWDNQLLLAYYDSKVLDNLSPISYRREI